MRAQINKEKTSAFGLIRIIYRHALNALFVLLHCLCLLVGFFLFSCSAQTYLDFVAGIATCCLGHAHPVTRRVYSYAPTADDALVI